MKTKAEVRYLMPRVLPFLIAWLYGRAIHPIKIAVRSAHGL